jgi:hypothetical protein
MHHQACIAIIKHNTLLPINPAVLPFNLRDDRVQPKGGDFVYEHHFGGVEDFACCNRRKLHMSVIVHPLKFSAEHEDLRAKSYPWEK